MSRRNQNFQTIRSEGGLLPPDLLRRLLDPQSNLKGMKPEDYGLPQGERLNAVITQSWNRLRKHWTEFRSAASNLPDNEPATGLTNDKWNLPLLRELGFGLLPATTAPEINGRTYAINRFLGPVPIHLIGCGLNPDKRAAGVRGAAAANPHGLVQEFLNRSPGHLWGIVSNGLRLRILRDNAALSRQSFLEFDLEAMFDGEVYSDFVLLWLVAHATRFAPREANRPDSCWIEKWTKIADKEGTRALGDLRIGVEKALQVLGEGFTSHPKNNALRDALRTNRLSLSSFHGQLLRVVYRFIFLFVAEDRSIEGQPLLHPRDDSNAAQLARERCAAHYSTGRLREMAGKIKGSRHGDLWRQFQLLVGALSGDPAFATVRERLALPALGSFLWNPNSTADLNNAELTNHDLLEALRYLAFTRQGKVLRPVDYRNLGAEELGGVYESLLSLTPQISADGARFSFAEFAGSERKTSGSYYTPDSLVQCLLDSALDPVVAEALEGKSGTEAETALLALKVCDPAVGSGHFLVGAAHRLARHLARVRAFVQGESEPSPLLYQQALRDVISRCLYGVDVNPMAAELCRVSLWLEALEPGKPLSFLDHHIQYGNSLLGTTPALIEKGIPDEAFAVLEGDDKVWTSALKKRNKQEKEGQTSLIGLFAKEPDAAYGSLSEGVMALDNMPDDNLDAVRSKEETFHRLSHSPEYVRQKLVANAWCAAFIWEKTKQSPEAITTSLFLKLRSDPEAVNKATGEQIHRYAHQYRFFHWHLAFPDVFKVSPLGEASENMQTAWSGGFDVVLGNPPWERVKLQEREWFAIAKPDIAAAKSASARRKLILALPETDPVIYRNFLDAKRQAEAESQYVRQSGLFPLCGRGDVNTYSVFTELARALAASNGRAGLVIPSGIATDETTSDFFSDLVDNEQLVSLYGFENEGGFFPGLMHNFKFALLTISGNTIKSPDLSFSIWNLDELKDPIRHFILTKEDFALLNPATKTCPLFKYGYDAEITKQIYRSNGTLHNYHARVDAWRISYDAMLHMTNDSGYFKSLEELSHLSRVGNRFEGPDEEYLPLYEAKMIFFFDHRYASAVESKTGGIRGSSEYTTDMQHRDRAYSVQPRFWVSREAVKESIEGKKWLIGFRGITGAVVNLRTTIFSFLPAVAVGNTMPLVEVHDADIALASCLVANMNSIILDYITRQKLGGTALNFFILNQLAVISPKKYEEFMLGEISAKEWIAERVLELTYTSDDMKGFADDFGYLGSPFVWNEGRREVMMRELDAAFALLYGLNRDQLIAILEHFRSLAKIEANDLGEYRTKRLVLEIYDEMVEAIRTGVPYETRLDPPPADPRVAHPKLKIGILAYGSLIGDPGEEIKPKIKMRLKTVTPFPVEYGRYSGRTRGGAPTLVKHEAGVPVAAEILVLDDSITFEEARDMLWRRERDRVGSGETYKEGTSPDSVLVREHADSPIVNSILYTDFHQSGKVANPNPDELAKHAIESVRVAKEGKDGITYLINAIAAGIITPITTAYRNATLQLTKTTSLEEALRIVTATKEQIDIESLRWYVLLYLARRYQELARRHALKVFTVKLLYIAEVCKEIKQNYPWKLQQFGPYPEGKVFDKLLDSLRSQTLIESQREESQVGEEPIVPTATSEVKLKEMESKFGLSTIKTSLDKIVDDFKNLDGKGMELRATLIYLHKNNPLWTFDVLVAGLKKEKGKRFGDNEIEAALIELQRGEYVKQSIG